MPRDEVCESPCVATSFPARDWRAWSTTVTKIVTLWLKALEGRTGPDERGSPRRARSGHAPLIGSPQAAGAVRLRVSASTAAAAFATAVPSKNFGFCVPHSRTALANVKSRKSSLLINPSSISS